MRDRTLGCITRFVRPSVLLIVNKKYTEEQNRCKPKSFPGRSNRYAKFQFKMSEVRITGRQTLQVNGAYFA